MLRCFFSTLKINQMRYPFLLLIAFTFISCSNYNSANYYKISGFAQGTTYSIIYKGGKDYRLEIDSILKAFDMSLSTYKDSSIISRINKNDSSVKTDSLFDVFFKTSYEVWKNTKGDFDITVAPIVNIWGFGFTERLDNIKQNTIDSLLQYVGMEKVKLIEGKVIKSSPYIMLDGNAIAQGYSIDVVANFLDENKINNYMVEIGGEIKASGVNAKSQAWKIGIDKPIDDSLATNRELKAILQIKNKAVATSGNYRAFYNKDGRKYSHTINPHTGYPVNHNLLSATVLANKCITADAYATAFMVMGYDKSIEFVKNNPGLDIYLIADDGKGSYKTYLSEGMKKYLEKEF